MKNGGAKIKRKQSDLVSDKSGESLTEEEIIENSFMSFLNKLMIYEEHIRGYNYWWEHVTFLNSLTDFIHCFNVPKMIELVKPWIDEQLNTAIDPKKKPLCELLVSIIYHNYKREEWLEMIEDIKRKYG